VKLGRSQPGSLWRASRWIDQDSCRCNARPSPPSLEHLSAKHPGIVYARIIGAIADGTDTPSLRRALLSLESEKVELESAMAMYHRPAFVEPPPVPDLEKLFRRKVEMLEQSLGDDPTITTQAATILRALIEGIVLHPRKKRGSGKKRATMSIEVYGRSFSFSQ
jgi:hypothetical protein